MKLKKKFLYKNVFNSCFKINILHELNLYNYSARNSAKYEWLSLKLITEIKKRHM